MKRWLGPVLAGLAAGSVTGLLGAGGGMVLAPLLTVLTDLPEEAVFPASITIMAPICLVSLMLAPVGLDWRASAPYLAGSALGGIAAGVWGKKIPVRWLHRGLGLLILWGGWRMLC